VIERVKLKIQPRRDAEVAAAAAKTPEQVRILVRTRVNDVAVRSDHLGSHQVVARQPVLCGQVADAAAKREPGDAGGADDAAGRDKTVGLRRGVEVEPCRTAAGARDPRVVVDIDLPHGREIDHEPAVAHAVARRIVTASAHGDLEVGPPCVVEGRRDVGGGPATNDHGRPAIDESVEAAACSVVLAVLREHDGPGKRLAELVETHLTARPATRQSSDIEMSSFGSRIGASWRSLSRKTASRRETHRPCGGARARFVRACASEEAHAPRLRCASTP
jgi:hypothetical protein